jgi:hypothetical protein
MKRKGWLTIHEVAAKFHKHPNTIRRFLREGRIKGKKLKGRSGGEWLVSIQTELKPPAPTGPAALTDPELRQIYHMSRGLTVGVDEALIREMIKRGFFQKSIPEDEFARIEAVAIGVMRDKTRWVHGKSLEEREPELIWHAEPIVSLRSKLIEKYGPGVMRDISRFLA